ncbi:M15 family metallopeptidase [Xanthomonas prunicola]|uniref:M15 family metallopeptidase n=1 Tax=Xanthomonas prunicola TaxID=2053930 RepID=UPI0021B28B04|nr:M15 family metallopeptidase [Xanthomonas prunicola]UXA54762.1 M15 family metallopeptidase [Xanthomonas prunicola]UXA71382.1 M15 family metallopeptidase [Xanthomonas prunicola]
MKRNLLVRKGRRWRQRFLRDALLLIAMAPSALVASEVHVSSAKTAAEAGLVDVHALAPDIALDMRYASSNNFTGQVVPGYHAPRCYLLRPAADALARVAQTLKAEGYRLQVFDCYRPVRSVKAFVAWAAALQDQATKAQYYPRVDKRALLGDYIAPTSGHSRGATLDLGLLECKSTACHAVDMGTGFDFFDARAHTDAPDISAAQRAHRQRLLRAMAAEGFANYPMEWWHFTFRPEPTPDTAYDVPVD